MKKKVLASILALSILATAGVAVASCVAFKDKPAGETTQTQPSVDQVTDENGEVLGDEINVMPARMIFRNARVLNNTSEYDSVTIQATIKPDNATNKNVSWSVAFVNPESTWAKGKNVADYISVTPQAVGSNIATVECLQPFGEQIKVIVTSESNVNAKAECKIDFAKRIVKAHMRMEEYGNNASSFATDFSADGVYLSMSLDKRLWLDEPYQECSAYTVDDSFEVTFKVCSNLNVVDEFSEDTGLLPQVSAIEEYKPADVILGSLLDTLEGVDWSDPECYNALNNWLKENPNKVMFTIYYKAEGQYSTYEAELPIYLNVDGLNVLATEIILNQSHIII